MRVLIRLAHLIDRLNRGVARAVAWLLLVMVLVGAYNAIARYLEADIGWRLSSNSLLELQWYCFGLAFLLGAPYALRRGEHVRVDVLYAGLPLRGRYWIDLAGTLCFLLPFCAFAIFASIDFVLDSWSEQEMSNDPGGLPRYPLKLMVPVAFALLGLQGLSEAIKRAALLRGFEPAEVGLIEPGDGSADRGDEGHL